MASKPNEFNGQISFDINRLWTMSDIGQRIAQVMAHAFKATELNFGCLHYSCDANI